VCFTVARRSLRAMVVSFFNN